MKVPAPEAICCVLMLGAFNPANAAARAFTDEDTGATGAATALGAAAAFFLPKNLTAASILLTT